jgi:hypothetical protein
VALTTWAPLRQFFMQSLLFHFTLLAKLADFVGLGKSSQSLLQARPQQLERKVLVNGILSIGLLFLQILASEQLQPALGTF